MSKQGHITGFISLVAVTMSGMLFAWKEDFSGSIMLGIAMFLASFWWEAACKHVISKGVIKSRASGLAISFIVIGVTSAFCMGLGAIIGWAVA